MRLNDIKDKRRLLKNTPSIKIINILSVSLGAASFLITGYLVTFQREKLAYYSEKFLGIIDLDKVLRERAEKPVKGQQYKIYIEEKRRIEKELEQETLERLKKIKEKLNKENSPQTSNTNQLETKQPPQDQTQSQVQPKKSFKSRFYYYISFGYWNNQKTEALPKKD